jgi:antitoxin YefM
LMKQIAKSLATHDSNNGYKPTKEQLDEIISI